MSGEIADCVCQVISSFLTVAKRQHTILLGAGMNNATTCVAKHSMHHTILLAEECLVMLAFLDIVYLHTVVTFGGKKQGTFIVKIQRQN